MPLGPEPYGVMLFSFWWTSLYVLPIFFWKKSNWPLRGPLLLLVGLNSLAGSSLFLVFFLAYLINKKKSNLFSGVLLIPGFIIQVVAAFQSSRASNLDFYKIILQFFANFGSYSFGWIPGITFEIRYLIGIFITIFLLLSIVLLYSTSKKVSQQIFLAFVALVVLSFLSSIPAPQISNQLFAAARYYLLPFAGLIVVLVMIGIHVSSMSVRALIFVIILGSLLGFIQTLGEKHLILSWKDEVYLYCESRDDDRGIPIHTDGTAFNLWYLPLSDSTCNKLLG
jgi:hypothetical protein